MSLINGKVWRVAQGPVRCLLEVYLPSLLVKLNTSPWILINLRCRLYLDMLFYSLRERLESHGCVRVDFGLL